MNAHNIATATTAELLAFFNANTGGSPVKKFADRKTAERRCQALADEMFAEDQVMVAANPDYQAAVDSEEFNRPHAYAEHGHQTCPHCGIDLNNGVGEHMQEVNGTYIKHEQYQYECLGCGEEFGPAIKARKASVSTGKKRPAMSSSLKLDRRVLHMNTGDVYNNACQVWKAGLVSSSQCDRLSGVLYNAAKVGLMTSVNVNGHDFRLACASD